MKLPASVQEIVDVIGRDRALYLVGRLPAAGGRSWRRVLYVPKRLDTDTGRKLVEMVGREDAEKLRRHFGGEILQPGNCGNILRAYCQREVRRMADQGCAPADIAEVVGLSEYRVREILRSTEGKAPEDRTAANDNGQHIETKAVRGKGKMKRGSGK